MRLNTRREQGEDILALACVCTVVTKAGIFDARFGEILRYPLLQKAEKRKFQPDSRKPGVTDPSLSSYSRACSKQMLA